MRPDGRRRLYASKPEPLRELDAWLIHDRTLWEDRLDRSKAKVVVERTYRAAIEDVWDLWTTKEGFESWWGPQGFRVEVQEIAARVDGALRFEMIADAPERSRSSTRGSAEAPPVGLRGQHPCALIDADDE